MRTTRRMIILLGCIGFIALYVLQTSIALAATPLILLTGVCAGLVIAKWLPWAWYGRQFAAGARAGVLACGLASAGMLLSLVGTGPHSTQEIAGRSRVLGVSLAHVVALFGGSGWFTPYVLLTAACGLGGVLAAGVAAQIAGWSKNVRTVRVISDAHTAASSLHRSQTWGPATNSAPSIGGYWNAMLPSAGPASLPGLLATDVTGGGQSSFGQALVAVGSARSSSAPSALPSPQPTYLNSRSPRDMSASAMSTSLPAALALPDLPDMPDLPEEPEAAEPIPPRRADSGAHPVQFAMTDDIREALDHWNTADAAPEDEPAVPKKASAAKSATASKAKTPAKTPSKRQPKASAYLNSTPAAAPRRSRKKQQTRDWLC